VSREPREYGGAIVEASVMLLLFALVTMGFGQQYLVTMDHLHHRAVATELLLGPQEPPLKIVRESETSDPGTPEEVTTTTVSFATLDGADRQAFLDRLGRLFVKRAERGTTLYVRIAYLPVVPRRDPAVPSLVAGVPSGAPILGEAEVYTSGSEAAECLDPSIESRFAGFSTDFMTRLSGHALGGARPAPIGIKLFKVTLDGEEREEYIDFLPVVLTLFCSPSRNLIFPQASISELPLIPARLVN